MNILRTTSWGLCALLVMVPTGVLAQTEASSTATGISRLMNPSISLNSLLLGQVSRDVPTREANQFDLQELELRFTSVVDPFWTADMIIGFHAHGHGDEGEHEAESDHEAEGESGIVAEVEKVMVEYRNMPRNLGLRVGKDHLDFGKHNPLHTHMYAFVKAPVGITAFLGDEVLTATGIELAWNTPLPWWSELKVYAANASAEIFDPESRDPAYGARLSNLWDSSDFSTLELGLSALTGPGVAPADLSADRWNMYGADLTWKWVSGSRAGGPAVNFTNEILLPDPEYKLGSPLGFYSQVQYRFGRQWWLGVGTSVARDAIAGTADAALHTLREFKFNVTLTPSEFSAIRFEVYREEDLDGDYEDLGAYVQVNFTIGSHPAHAY